MVHGANFREINALKIKVCFFVSNKLLLLLADVDYIPDRNFYHKNSILLCHLRYLEEPKKI